MRDEWSYIHVAWLTLEESADMSLSLFRIHKHRSPSSPVSSSSCPMLPVFAFEGDEGSSGKTRGIDEDKVPCLGAEIFSPSITFKKTDGCLCTWRSAHGRARACVQRFLIFQFLARAMECSLLLHNRACARWKNARWETEDEMWQCGKCLAFPLSKFIYSFIYLFIFFDGIDEPRIYRHWNVDMSNDDWRVYSIINSIIFVYNIRKRCLVFCKFSHFIALSEFTDCFQTTIYLRLRWVEIAFKDRMILACMIC